MLVESMSFDEVRKEILSDKMDLWNWYKWQKKDVERYFYKQSKFPCTHTLEWTSHNKNKWIIFIVAFKRSHFNGGHGILPVCIQKYPKGYAAHELARTKDKYEYVITQLPHFFDRYAERTGCEKTGIELIKHFFRKNNSGDNDETKEFSGKNSRDEDVFHTCYAEGIGLGEKVNEIHVVLKTFITYNMTSGGQKTTFSDLKSFSDNYAKLHREMWLQD